MLQRFEMTVAYMPLSMVFAPEAQGYWLPDEKRSEAVNLHV